MTEKKIGIICLASNNKLTLVVPVPALADGYSLAIKSIVIFDETDAEFEQHDDNNLEYGRVIKDFDGLNIYQHINSVLNFK